MDAKQVVFAVGLFVSATSIGGCASKPESKDKGFMTYEEYKANAPEPEAPRRSVQGKGRIAPPLRGHRGVLRRAYLRPRPGSEPRTALLSLGAVPGAVAAAIQEAVAV